MKTTMTIDCANEVIDNIANGYSIYTTKLPAVKDWLLEKMNDNYLRWLGGMITDNEYKDIMIQYSDLAGMIENVTNNK
jgi:hypothetical protein